MLETPSRLIELGGMSAEIKAAGNRWHIHLSAPTQGWVGIGFNDRPQMTGTHLLLGRVIDQSADMNEYHVFGPGDPRLLQEIGAKASVEQVLGKEANGTTSLSFSIPMEASDRWHHPLRQGQSVYIWLAFSVSDDWTHHSRMRKGTWITL